MVTRGKAKRRVKRRRGANGKTDFRGKRNFRRNPFAILAQLAALSLLVTAAFYAPQAVFQVQDTILCGKTTLGERESMDVETLSTTYEQSLRQRMMNFAEGLETDVNFYVASKDLPIGEEIYEFIESKEFLIQDPLCFFADAAMIPIELWLMQNPLVITQWKQYVIYSDDYARGVNFILWYVEMRYNQESAEDIHQDVVLKLLVDAEAGTLYAFKTEDYNESNQMIESGFWHSDVLLGLWHLCSMYYEVKFPEELEEVIRQLETILGYDMWMIDGYIKTPYDPFEVFNSGAIWEGSEWNIQNQVTGYVMEGAIALSETGNEMMFRLPYGEDVSLEMKIHIEDDSVLHLAYGEYLHSYPNATVGIRQIYEMIPEFE